MKRSTFCVTVFKTTIYISISMWLLKSESGESLLVASRTTTGELVACISTVKNNIQTKITTGFFSSVFVCYDSRMVFKMILFITVWMSRSNNALKCMYLTAATAYRTILPMMWFLLIHFLMWWRDQLNTATVHIFLRKKSRFNEEKTSNLGNDWETLFFQFFF